MYSRWQKLSVLAEPYQIPSAEGELNQVYIRYFAVL